MNLLTRVRDFDDVRKQRLRVISYVLVVFVPHLIVYVLAYPGFLQADHQSLIARIAIGEPSQWHSLLWGYLSYPLLYLSPSYGLYGLLQTSVFVCCVVYSAWSLVQLGLITYKGGYIFSLFFGIAPTYLLYNELYASDIVFAYLLMPLTIFLLRIVISKGKELSDKRFVIFFILLLFLAYELRKNAILIPFFTFIILFLLYRGYRRKIVAIFLTLVVAIGITNIFWDRVVDAAPSPSQEMLSVPTIQIGYVFVHDGDIPDDVREDLLNIRSEEEWKNRYLYYCADGEKDGVELTASFVKDWFIVGLHNPLAYVRAYADLMHPYWQFTANNDALNMNIDFGEHTNFTLNICDNQCKDEYVNEITTSQSPVGSWISSIQEKIVDSHLFIISDLLRIVFFNRALPLWIFIIGFCISLVRRRIREYLIICIPLFSILLSLLFFSPIASFRYAFQAFCILPIIVLCVWNMFKTSGDNISVG